MAIYSHSVIRVFQTYHILVSVNAPNIVLLNGIQLAYIKL